MAVEDFGGTVLGKPIEVVSADHQNKPEIASAIARKWYDVEKVDMIANLINSSVALGVSQIAKDKDTDRHRQRLGSSRLTNDGMHAEQRTLRLRHLFAGARYRRRADEGGRNELVFPHRRLCVRSCAGSRHVRRREGLGGASAGFGTLSSGALDQSSFLLKAQSSQAKVVALAGSGTVFVNAVKSAHEFGIEPAGRRLPAFWSGSPTSRASASKRRRDWC